MDTSVSEAINALANEAQPITGQPPRITLAEIQQQYNQDQFQQHRGQQDGQPKQKNPRKRIGEDSSEEENGTNESQSTPTGPQLSKQAIKVVRSVVAAQNRATPAAAKRPKTIIEMDVHRNTIVKPKLLIGWFSTEIEPIQVAEQLERKLGNKDGVGYVMKFYRDIKNFGTRYGINAEQTISQKFKLVCSKTMAKLFSRKITITSGKGKNYINISGPWTQGEAIPPENTATTIMTLPVGYHLDCEQICKWMMKMTRFPRPQHFRWYRLNNTDMMLRLYYNAPGPNGPNPKVQLINH